MPEEIDIKNQLQNFKFAINQHAIAAITDKSGSITYVNDKFCELSKYSREELLGQDHRIINSGNHPKKFFSNLYKTIQAGKVWKGEIKNKAKDGTYFWVDTTITPLKNSAGEITDFLSIQSDITQTKLIEEELRTQNLELLETKQALQEVIAELEEKTDQLSDANKLLKESEEKYIRDNLLLVESQAIAKLGGWELDVVTGHLYWTAETYRIHDTTPEEFNPTVDAGVSYFLPESKRIISEALLAAMTKGQGYDLNLETYTTKGRKIDVRTTCVVTMDGEKPIKLTGIFQDITEQKKAQAEIETYNSRLSLATSTANIGIWEYILDNKTLIWDEKMFSLFDVSKNDFSGTYEAWRSTVHPDDLERSEKELENAIATGQRFNTEFRIIWRDKSVHHIKAMAEVVCDGSGRQIKVIGVNYDITESIQKEIELTKAKEKAEENDRLKSAFLANMRHEIRNPMNAIIGFSKQMTAKSTSESKRAEYSSIVINSANQLLNIIDDITAISLLETKQEHINKSQVNINGLLSELEMQFAPQAKTRNLELILTKSLPEKESIITTDKSKLTRVITNLLTNALKFTHEGVIRFGYEIKNKDLLFFVQDSGIGISPDNLKRIFESFQQADSGISRKYGGTGLGLSISKGLTEILGGQIWVESEVGKGSIFYVTLPFDQVKTHLDQPGAKGSAEFNNIILIAEDELINFLYLKILIENNFDCEILHAANGEKAVELFKKNPGIKLVLLDISMPVMDGFDAAGLIKETKPDLHIIAQTGYDIEQNEKYSPDIFDDYITKPIIDNVLISKIASFIPKMSNGSKKR